VGIPAAYLVDPLALLWRALAFAVYPLALAGSRLGLDAARSLLEPLTSTTPLAISVPVRTFAGALLSAALVAVILAANRLAPRLWCSGRWLRRRVDADLCLDCTRCSAACPVSGTAAARAERSAGAPAGECLACGRCSDACPVGAVSFELTAPRVRLVRKVGRRAAAPASASASAGEPPPWGVSRRRFLGAAAGGFGGLLLVDRVAFASTVAEPALRPPGARSEAELLERCVRCGVCMQACPTNAVQPDLAPGGFTGFFAPVLVMRRGGCDPACTRCGEVCPTGALHELDAGAKRRWVIGTAVVEADRCLRARGEDCRICVETCPYQAVEVVPGAAGPSGTGLRVLADRCTGCGLCEFRCPVPAPRGSAFSDRAAVRVVTAAEAARLAPAPTAPARDESHLPLFLRTS
jgi:NAD-dependent dihydropyrimidine dehydrogenase PreA subunit